MGSDESVIKGKGAHHALARHLHIADQGQAMHIGFERTQLI